MVVVQREDRRAVTGYRWGLIPHWAENAKVGSRMFNARAETLTTSPAFREAFRRRRCLVPVDSFYEWKREGTVRQPYRVLRTDRRPLALAGLWAGWKDPATETVRRTFTIVTTTPNAALSRPPRPDAGGRRGGRLGPLAGRRAAPIRASCSGCSSRTSGSPSRSTPWSASVNDVRRDGPSLIEPLPAPADEPVAPGLFDRSVPDG